MIVIVDEIVYLKKKKKKNVFKKNLKQFKKGKVKPLKTNKTALQITIINEMQGKHYEPSRTTAPCSG